MKWKHLMEKIAISHFLKKTSLISVSYWSSSLHNYHILIHISSTSIYKVNESMCNIYTIIFTIIVIFLYVFPCLRRYYGNYESLDNWPVGLPLCRVNLLFHLCTFVKSTATRFVSRSYLVNGNKMFLHPKFTYHQRSHMQTTESRCLIIDWKLQYFRISQLTID